jgi:putative glutamine amidotransferase
MNPIIGITSTKMSARAPLDLGIFVPDGYVNGIVRCGAIPVVIPLVEDDAIIKELIDRVDGVLFTGGEDIGPHLYSEIPHQKLGEVNSLRDRIEMEGIRYALSKNKPILGICRGVQLLNVAMGGTLYQDLPSQLKDSGQHFQKAPRSEGSHFVSVSRESKVYDIFQLERVFVNSYHHQAIKDPAPGFVVTAKADDGVVEALESTVHSFAMGLQWHPEMMWSMNEQMLEVSRYFVHAVRSAVMVGNTLETGTYG